MSNKYHRKMPFKRLQISLIVIFIFLLNVLSPSILGDGITKESSLNTDENVQNILKQNTLGSDIFPNDILYSGKLNGLDINETAKIQRQDSIQLGNGDVSGYDSSNLSFYIDKTHNWQVEKYNSTISDISDEQNWVVNSGFGTNENLTANITVVQTFTDGFVGQGEYDDDMIADPNSPLATIDGLNSDYMRLHFVFSYTEARYDYVMLWDENNELIKYYCGHFDDFYTPWFNTSTIKIGINSDNINVDYGFEIDFYEMYNGSMHDDWTYYRNETISYALRSDGSMDNYTGQSSVYAQIEGQPYGDGSYTYYDGDESGFVQNITIPRGNVIEAWISMDYFLYTGMSTNDLFIFYKINGDIVYTRGFITINNLGNNTWHSTGLISTILWENTTNIFDNDISDDNINISFGIGSAKSSRYSGFVDREIQRAYFDNVRLILKTKTNSTLSDVNLQFNGNSLTDNPSVWGNSIYEETNIWTNDPLNISMNTSAPKLEFDVSSEVFGYHYTTSKESENGKDGLQLSINGDNSIIWDFYHNVYRPTGYQNYEYIINKPYDWNITSVKDPTDIETLFEGGLWSDNYVKINELYAFFPGWWHFTAESTNLVMRSETMMWNRTEWKLYDDISDGSLYYDVDDVISIQSKLDESKGLINSVELTEANITIYHPNETIWFTESINPDISANIQFTNLTVGAFNTTGGMYTYKIIWTNGTSAGGINGTFEIRHNAQYKIQYPRDAELDNSTDKYLGEVIPIRLIINDSVNGLLLHGANVVYNWSSGSVQLTEISNGIFDSSMDTLDIGAVGVYFVQFNITKSGYYNLSFVLTINLLAATNIKILNIDNNIELGSNFSLEVEYSIDPSGNGIDEALIELNMSLSEYSVLPGSQTGIYMINVSTESVIAVGYLDIMINASKILYEKQVLVTRVQILPTSVYLNLFVNESDCTSNKSWNDIAGNLINFTVEVYNSIDDSLVSGGTVKITETAGFEQEFLPYGNVYNVLIDSSTVGIGIHYLSIIFNKSDYETTSVVFILGIVVRDSYLEIFVNGSDCTSNSSWNDKVGNFINFTVNIFDELTDQSINDGSVNITNNQGFMKSLQFSYGTYSILVDTLELGFGTHYLNIIFNKTNYETRSKVFILSITPIEVYLKLSINSFDHSLNKSGVLKINQIANISVNVFSLIGNHFISSATLKIDNYDDFNDIFAESGAHYQFVFNTSELGVGVHFLNVIFNKTDYITTSIILQLKIERLVIKPSFYQTESTILGNPKKNFEATIYIVDENTGSPLLGAEIAYSWLYGTGLLEELGDGYYLLSEIMPSQEGTYTIEISISAGDLYFTSTIDLTIISQRAKFDVRTLWWLFIPIGLILFALIGIVVKQNIIIPKREKEFELLKLKTQIFDDVTNIRGVMVIQKMSGLLLFKKIISGMDEENETLFTGFLNAIMMLSQSFTKSEEKIDNENGNNSESIEFKHENFNILVMDGEDIRIAVILEGHATLGIKQMVNKFINEFEGIFSSLISNWDGNTSIFEETGSALIEETFNLSLLEDYTLTKSSNMAIIERKLVTTNSISERTLNIIKTLVDERTNFKLKTVISLTPEVDKVPAKDVLLKFMKNKLLVHPDENIEDPLENINKDIEEIKRDNS